MYRPGFKIAMKAACGGGPAGLTGPANLSGRLSAHRFEVVIVLLWLIRASWLIGGTIAHPINRRTRINHNLSGCLTAASHWRIAGHARITSRGPGLPRQGASGHRKAPTPAKAAPGSQAPLRCYNHWSRPSSPDRTPPCPESWKAATYGQGKAGIEPDGGSTGTWAGTVCG